MYRFTSQLVKEAKQLAKATHLKEMDYEDALVAVWFRYAGLKEIPETSPEERNMLLRQYFDLVSYPEDHRSVVETAIEIIANHKNAASILQQVVYDAIYS